MNLMNRKEEMENLVGILFENHRLEIKKRIAGSTCFERENKNESSKHSWALLSPQHSDATEGKDSGRPETAETTASILVQIQFFLWEHGRGYAAGYYPANFTLKI